MTQKIKFAPILLAVTLGFGVTGHAQASDASDLLSAREAYRRHNDEQLADYARTLNSSLLAAYPRFWIAQRALEREDSDAVSLYLQNESPSALTEKIRSDWLKWLAKHDLWNRFGQEWNKLPEAARDEENRCNGDYWQLTQGQAPTNLERFLEARTLPEACNRLIAELARRKLVDQNWLLTRVHLLEASNNLPAARDIAQRTNLGIDEAFDNRNAATNQNSQAGSEAMLINVLTKMRTDQDGAAAILMAQEPTLGPDRAKFAWGQLGLFAAKRLSMSQALQWFEKSDPKQLTQEQWEWWARAALRNEQWTTLELITRAMPANLAAKQSWHYWRARALQKMGRETEASVLFAEASRTPGFYGVLAQEELGNTLDTSTPMQKPMPADMDRVGAEPAIKRARMLMDIADRQNRPELREDARREWRWAMRDKSDIDLLASAELARRDGWYDIAIYSAERTKQIHDFSLRYLTPYREITERYATQLGVDEAWVYGLIRQESRFVTVARSGVGASGLMQLMPATARWAARKMGLGAYAVNNIDNNIQLGTWYLRYVLNSLGHPVLATAAYNAGPNRARAWEDGRPLEGAIYAETIPFNETRDYVQKVMSNAAYYASGLGHTPLSLKARLGMIPAR